MDLKKACTLWMAIYFACAIAIGLIAARRMLIAAAPAGFVGGFLLWVGIAYLAGIGVKVSKARKLGAALRGDTPRDGNVIAVEGRIMPIQETLTSPFERVPCVAYSYKIQMPQGRTAAQWEYQGIALAPSVIQGPRGSMKLLAFPELDVPEKLCSGALQSARDYVGSTEFTDWVPFVKDDTKKPRVRYDHKRSHPEKLEYAMLYEKVVPPGQDVCVFGLYSATEGGLTHEKDVAVPSLTLMNGDAAKIQRTLIRRSIGNAIGGVIFLAATIVGLGILYANVPLEASEQLNPNRKTWWWEVRLERFLDQKLQRPPHDKRQESTPTNYAIGIAHGRIEVNGREVDPTAAAAARARRTYRVALMDGAMNVGNATIEIRPQHRLTHLDLLGTTIAPEEFAQNGELECLDWDDDKIEGRITYLGSDGQPRCRVAFKAPVTLSQ
jgi:hypothetical protein